MILQMVRVLETIFTFKISQKHNKSFKKNQLNKSRVPVNIGMGKGISVLNLIKIFEEVNNIKVPYKIEKKKRGYPIIFQAI